MSTGTQQPSASSLREGPDERWPQYDGDSIEAVVAVLQSGRVNQWTGEHVKAFESELASYFGVPHAIAVANGSLALELALKAYGIGPGDEVIVTPRSFVASVSCVSMVGATPVFADVDADSQNITAETIERCLTPKTKAIVPVHLAGWPCDMPAIMALADRHGLVVVEDCAQSHGAGIAGKKAGSFGHAAAFSFCTDKIMSTGGEGGALLLQDDAAWRKAWQYKDHGKSLRLLAQKPDKPGFRWLIEAPGTNWRMTEMQAAIGRLQLTQLDQWMSRRRTHADIWRRALSSCSALRVPWPSGDVEPACYKFYAFLETGDPSAGTVRDNLLEQMSSAGLKAFSGSCPEIYLEAAFSHLTQSRLPVAQRLGETSLMFEVHPTLDTQKLEQRALMCAEIINQYTSAL